MDLCFAPGSYSLYIAHTWGAYEMLLKPGICGFKLDSSYLYPDCVNGNYKGLGIDIGFIGEGNMKINVSGQEKEIQLFNEYSSGTKRGSHFKVYWDGKDNEGNPVPPGEYTVEFLSDETVISHPRVDVLSFPAVEILNGEYIEISRLDVIDYQYRIQENGFLTISLSKPGNNNRLEWENEIKQIKISRGDYTEQITRTDLPDGYYGINFHILPPALMLKQAKPVTSTVYFSVNDAELVLGDILLLSDGFSPESVGKNTIGAQFTLSESALVSVWIYDENESYITSLSESALFSNGTKEIGWDGYTTENQAAGDGRYYFIIQAHPVGSPESPIQKQSSLFVLDASPPEITISDRKPVYYISPDEPSSTGVQDDFSIIVNIDEDTLISARILDQQERNVKDIVSLETAPAGNDITVTWNGTDSENMYCNDDRYTFVMESLDAYGNLTGCRIPVIVDNNQPGAEPNVEGIIGLDEYKVDDDTDTYIDALSIEQITGGYVIAWNDLDYDDRFLAVFDEAGTVRRSQFSVKPDPDSFCREYALSKTNDGFILIWQEPDGSLHYDVLKAQRFDEYGCEIGQRFELVRIANSSFKIKDIACRKTDNGYAVAWCHETNNTVWVQFFDENNQAITPPHKIAENTGGFVSLESTGSDVVALWQAKQEGPEDVYTTCVRKIEQDNPTSYNPVPLYTGKAAESTIVKLTSGFVVAGQNPGSYITAIQLDDDGNPTGKEIIINDRYYHHGMAISIPSVVPVDDGFVVAWHTTEWQIAARRINGDFIPSGGEIIISTSPKQTFYPVLCPVRHGFQTAWLLWKEQDPDAARYFIAVHSRKFTVIHPVTGGSLRAEILHPANESYPSDDVVYVSGIIDDAHMDYFTLSLVDSNNTVTELITQKEKNIDGEIYCLDAYSLTKGQRYTLSLEAWDKAGNYRNHRVDFIPQHNYEHYLLEYTIIDPFCSATKSLPLSFTPAQEAVVAFSMINSRNEVVETTGMGTCPATTTIISLGTGTLEEDDYLLRITLTALDDTWVYERLAHFIIDNNPAGNNDRGF
ncbi:MAG: hypothetical protein JXB88_08895 [Spirochaetales bacterium]|nr:hypothetical protein [Spirochaetales bacterium]